jgi:aldehyde:ferredoxin oxidoreductase
VDAKGYTGKTLVVDLSNENIGTRDIEEGILKEFIGGRGLGIKLLMDMTAPKIEPLSPENPLISMTGPYTGIGVFSAFFNITTKAPLTAIAGSSHCGGKWGPQLKRAGFDGIIVEGCARNPSYLLVEEGKAVLKDAGDLWGKGVLETEEIIKSKEGDVEIVSIGPAGENLVKFAAIMNGQRAAGRSGVGAVMGSKKLKAIAIKGKIPVEVHDKAKVAEMSRRGGKLAVENGKNFATYGTSMAFSFFNEKKVLPTKNFTGGYFPEADKINAEALKTQYFVKDTGCFNCPLKCGNVHHIIDGPYKVEGAEGPEYETLMAFGPNCGNANLESIIMANHLCNDLGLDTISCGNLLALLMDLSDQGITYGKEPDGVSLSWGDHKAMVDLIPKIALREGIGDRLAEGSYAFAEGIGPAALGRVIHAKKQEFPGYESRRSFGTGFSLVTSNRGADHLRATFYVNEIFMGELDKDGFEPHVDLLLDKEHLMAVVDSVCMCKFGQRNGQFTWPVLGELLSAVTGFELTESDLQMAGERIWNAERMYNLREGIEEDMLPERFFQEDLLDGCDGGEKVDRASFLNARSLYYRMRGWSEKGEPNSKKLKNLGLA